MDDKLSEVQSLTLGSIAIDNQPVKNRERRQMSERSFASRHQHFRLFELSAMWLVNSTS